MSNTEGTTAAPSSATIKNDDHLTYSCPDWCVSTPDDHDKPKAYFTDIGENTTGREFVVTVGHVAANFGVWSCTAEQNVLTGRMIADVMLDVGGTAYFEDPRTLRAMLDDGAKALAWMESVK